MDHLFPRSDPPFWIGIEEVNGRHYVVQDQKNESEQKVPGVNPKEQRRGNRKSDRRKLDQVEDDFGVPDVVSMLVAR